MVMGGLQLLTKDHIYADSNIIKAGTSASTRQLFVNAEIKAKKEPTHHETNNN